METTLWKTYKPVINLVHILSMMRKARVTMNTYRNKHFESIALNPGDGYIKRKFSLSHQSLLCARGVHIFLYGDYANRSTWLRCA